MTENLMPEEIPELICTVDTKNINSFNSLSNLIVILNHRQMVPLLVLRITKW